MKIVAVVPIKLNNVRLPNKNLKNFTNGKPLCYYILSTLLKVNEIDKVYIYCSNSAIVNYIPTEVEFLKRRETLDQDNTKMNEILKSFADKVTADIYVLCHATSPFISQKSIESGLTVVMNGKYDSAFAVKKIQDFLWKDGAPINYNLDDIPRTQDLQPLYMETSGFYIYKSEVINQMNRRIGNSPCLIEVDEIESIDIDEEIDFKIADAISNYILKQ